MDTEAEISIAQEYSRIFEKSVQEVSPLLRQQSKVFLPPSFTSPVNTMALIESQALNIKSLNFK